MREYLYIGKTKGDLETRIKEIKNGEMEKPTVTTYVWIQKHAMDRKSVLLKQASNKQELTNWENTLIKKKIVL